MITMASTQRAGTRWLLSLAQILRPLVACLMHMTTTSGSALARSFLAVHRGMRRAWRQTALAPHEQAMASHPALLTEPGTRRTQTLVAFQADAPALN